MSPENLNDEQVNKNIRNHCTTGGVRKMIRKTNFPVHDGMSSSFPPVERTSTRGSN